MQGDVLCVDRNKMSVGVSLTMRSPSLSLFIRHQNNEKQNKTKQVNHENTRSTNVLAYAAVHSNIVS